MKRLVIAGTSIVVVAVLVVSAPWLAGLKIQSAFTQAIAKLPVSDAFDVQVVDYERGWFHSRATTRVTLPDNVKFTVVSDISHGPYAPWGLADIRSRVVIDDNAPLQELLGGVPPLTAKTHVGYTGDIRLRAQSPAMHRANVGEQGVELTWKGAQFQLETSGDRIHYQLTAPGLRLARGPGVILFRGLEAEGSGVPLLFLAQDGELDHGKQGGQSTLKLQAYLIHLPKEGAHYEGSLLWQGDHGIDDNGDYGVDARLHLYGGVFGMPLRGRHRPFIADDLALQVLVSGVPTQLLGKLLHAVHAVKSHPAWGSDRRMQQVQTIRQLGWKLRTSGIRVDIKIPKTTTSLGRVGLQTTLVMGAVEAPADAAADAGAEADKPPRVTLNGHATATRALLRKLSGISRVLGRVHVLGRPDADDDALHFKFHTDKAAQFVVNGRQVPGLPGAIWRGLPL